MPPIPGEAPTAVVLEGKRAFESMENSGAFNERKGAGGGPQARTLRGWATPPEAWRVLKQHLWETVIAILQGVLGVRDWGCPVLRRTCGGPGAAVSPELGPCTSAPVTGTADAAGRCQGSALGHLASVLPATPWKVQTNAVTWPTPKQCWLLGGRAVRI